MSVVNQCTFSFTQTIPLVQYSKLCLTCSRGKPQLVKVCLNCASVCHDRHDLGPLSLDAMFCACKILSDCCKTLCVVLAAPSTNSVRQQQQQQQPEQIVKNEDKSDEVAKFIVWKRFYPSIRKDRLTTFATLKEANEALKELCTQNKLIDHINKAGKYGNRYEFQETKGVMSAKIFDDLEPLCEFGIEIHDPHKLKRKRSSGSPQDLSMSQNFNKFDDYSMDNRKTKTMKLKYMEDEDDDDDEMVLFQGMPMPTQSAKKTPASSITANSNKKHWKKIAGAPKGPAPSYMLYSNSVREQVASDNPQCTMLEISRLIGTQWKNMTDEEKGVWQDRARRDRERYEEEMKEFEKIHPEMLRGRMPKGDKKKYTRKPKIVDQTPTREVNIDVSVEDPFMGDFDEDIDDADSDELNHEVDEENEEIQEDEEDLESQEMDEENEEIEFENSLDKEDDDDEELEDDGDDDEEMVILQPPLSTTPSYRKSNPFAANFFSSVTEPPIKAKIFTPNQEILITDFTGETQKTQTPNKIN